MSYIKNYFLKKDQEVGTDKKYSLTIACLPEHFSSPGKYKGEREEKFLNYFYRLFELGEKIMNIAVEPNQGEKIGQTYKRLYDQIQQNIHDYNTDLDINDKMMLLCQSIKVFGSSRYDVCISLFKELIDAIYDCEVVDLGELCATVKLMKDQTGHSFIDYNEHAEYLVEKIKKLLIDYQALVDGNQIKNFFSGLKLLNQLSLLIDDSRIVSSLRSFIKKCLKNALKDFETHIEVYSKKFPNMKEVFELEDGFIINNKSIYFEVDDNTREKFDKNKKIIREFINRTRDYYDKSENLLKALLQAGDIDIALRSLKITSRYRGQLDADRCLHYTTKEVKKYLRKKEERKIK